ncbi:zinc ribbon domain-containing protein [Chitinilyticum litopenaei]|uniref:zinc ribbon domain-containing protein n=1 Tax=Chitinilyticum litopenaei TaxID=1121276 RepID=UPI0004222434|nr:zinc ribbon domain-containing protein [Chitinilyticum litopenaei]
MSTTHVPHASGFTLLLLRAGQMVAIGFAVLALLGFLGALVYVASRSGDAFKVPDFSQQQEEGELRQLDRLQGDVASQEIIVKLNTEYGEQILEIIKTHAVRGITTEQVIRMLVNIPENRRDQLLDGWDDFLAEGLQHYRKTGRASDNTADQLSEYYFSRFSRNLSETETTRQLAQAERISGVTLALGALIAFIVALLIPVLVQIERNTRALRLSAEGEPAPQAADAAPRSKVKTKPAAAPVAAGATTASAAPAASAAMASTEAAAPAEATPPAEVAADASPAAPPADSTAPDAATVQAPAPAAAIPPETKQAASPVSASPLVLEPLVLEPLALDPLAQAPDSAPPPAPLADLPPLTASTTAPAASAVEPPMPETGAAHKAHDCPQCRTVNDLAAAFCGECGYRLLSA